jgi:CheY-like chemotaxis protein
MIAEAARRGASVTRRLLAFSRRADLRAEAVDAPALLEDMREILSHTLGAGIEVRIQAPAALPPLLADKGQLETVLVNLAANARDAMGGAGVITLSGIVEEVPRGTRRPALPAALRAGAYLRLSVADTGAGMDAATLARAAEPFFTTKPLGKGTGLGLAMARGFAEQSGGALAIESSPGRGTTVRLWLPVAATDVRLKPSPAGMTRWGQAGRRARVLLVDDEALVREITAEALEAAGYAVLSAGSAAEAIEFLASGQAVDLLITDLSMPGMDGIALIREGQRRRPGLRAILLTGFATDAAELAIGGTIRGTFSLLRKPIEPAALAERAAVLISAMPAMK